eukprot:TRINITY_DN5586_c0_g1_i1.p1 TRINITY_DN5586_c0_g1~~TRINITY_DN5586_c0_g1_i1.p1  ORF type:complete len:182 (-),score=40.41 TRINITY_DN5586_c0_g1_i1:27-572(-)
MDKLDRYLGSSAVVSALLGTSCCAIQLFLNAFSFGCAGFAVLDPYNTFFTTLSTASLIGLLGYNYHNETLNTSNKSLWMAVAASLLLRSFPLIVDKLNNPTIDDQLIEEVIDLEIEGMKCKGCANAVHNALNSVEGVEQNSVFFDDRTAKIYTKGKKVTEAELDDALKPLGFKAKPKACPQ